MNHPPVFGAVEAGGTKFVVALGDERGELLEEHRFPTAAPSSTLTDTCAWLRRRSQAGQFTLAAIGVASFGPVELDRSSARYGCIGQTPKPGWCGTDIVGALAREFMCPIGFDTDVNAAALAEHRWGAARDVDHLVYLTVGTGIGGGAYVEGQLLRGIQHPEMGHMTIPHDRAADPFPGSCPYHGDCLEGLASGSAMRERWGRPAEELDDEAPWELEATYLALGLVNLTHVLAPERIIIGGGVARRAGLLALMRSRLIDLLAGYVDHPGLADGFEEYVTPPGLGELSGVLGAAELARAASPGAPVAT